MDYKSKVDIIHENLLGDIAKGIYRANDRLVIREIAKQMNVSDIPVREAIRRLESQGYVRVVANQGAVVCGINQDDLVAIFQVKGMIEAYASRISADYLKSEDIKYLRVLNKKCKAACEQGNDKEYAKFNTQLHLEIYNKIPSTMLYNMIVDLYQKWNITKSVFLVVPNRMEESYQEHEEIINLLEEKRYDEIEQHVCKHKLRSGNRWLEIEFAPPQLANKGEGETRKALCPKRTVLRFRRGS